MSAAKKSQKHYSTVTGAGRTGGNPAAKNATGRLTRRKIFNS